MDQELREFLSERFNAVDRQFQAVGQRIDAVDQRVEAVDQRVDGMRRDLTGRIDGARRELGTLVEGQQDQIRLIAEGHGVLLERIEAFQREMQTEFRETQAAIRLSYAELDRRITRLEAVTTDFDSRLSRLEREPDGRSP